MGSEGYEVYWAAWTSQDTSSLSSSGVNFFVGGTFVFRDVSKSAGLILRRLKSESFTFV